MFKLVESEEKPVWVSFAAHEYEMHGGGVSGVAWGWGLFETVPYALDRVCWVVSV